MGSRLCAVSGDAVWKLCAMGRFNVQWRNPVPRPTSTGEKK